MKNALTSILIILSFIPNTMAQEDILKIRDGISKINFFDTNPINNLTSNSLKRFDSLTFYSNSSVIPDYQESTRLRFTYNDNQQVTSAELINLLDDKSELIRTIKITYDNRLPTKKVSSHYTNGILQSATTTVYTYSNSKIESSTTYSNPGFTSLVKSIRTINSEGHISQTDWYKNNSNDSLEYWYSTKSDYQDNRHISAQFGELQNGVFVQTNGYTGSIGNGHVLGFDYLDDDEDLNVSLNGNNKISTITNSNREISFDYSGDSLFLIKDQFMKNEEWTIGTLDSVYKWNSDNRDLQHFKRYAGGSYHQYDEYSVSLSNWQSNEYIMPTEIVLDEFYSYLMDDLSIRYVRHQELLNIKFFDLMASKMGYETIYTGSIVNLESDEPSSSQKMTFHYSGDHKLSGIPKTKTEHIGLHPNPAFSNINLSFDSNIERTISVVNMQGAVIKELVSSSSSESIDMTNWTPGIYYITSLAITGEVSNSKLLKM